MTRPYGERLAQYRSLLGEDPAAGGAALREKLGVVMDDCGIPETLSLRDMRRILSAGYRTFDAGRFDALAARMEREGPGNA